jgi:predicted nucleotidyltransferase
MVLSSDEQEKISTSITTLRSRLNSYFGHNLKDMFIFGSYDRGTILPREFDDRSDVDVMVLLDYQENVKPQTYLNRVRKFVEQYYSTSEIHQSSPTIVLKLKHIKFELVPAKQSNYDLYYDGYQIPAPAKDYLDWITTYPKSIANDLYKKNKEENFNIKPIIRLLKYWNVRNYRVYSSFEIEQKAIACYFYSSDSSIFDYFYRLIISLDTNNLGPYSSGKLDSLKSKIRNVKSYLDNDMPISAELEIKKIFGE